MATRVVAARHSQIYGNVFSSITKDVNLIESADQTQPSGACCCCRVFCCCCTPSGTRYNSSKALSESPDPDLRDTLEVDTTSQTLLVGSGYTFKECEPALKKAGLILRGTPETDTITIGGALAVGAHGGGRFQKVLVGYLLEIWIRDSKGTVHHLNAGTPNFGAAAVSLGLLGIILKAKFQLEKPENRKVVASRVSSYDAAGIASADDSTHSFQFAPYQQRMVRYDETPTEQRPNCSGCINNGVRSLAALQCLFYVLDPAIACCPCMGRILSQSLVCPGTCVYDKFDTFTPTPANYAFTVEYAIDVSLAGQAFEALKKVVADNASEGRYVTFRFWCRFLKGVDQSYTLAQSAGGDKVAFECTFSQKQRGVEKFLDAIVEVCKQYGGRPHLGKTIRPKDVAYAAQVYGSAFGGQSWLAFEEARKSYDPEGKFLNEPLQEFVKTASQAAAIAAASR